MRLLFAQITGFDWDKGNQVKNEKHSVSTAESEQVFFNDPLIVVEDANHSNIEKRYHALGKTNDDRLLHITFTIRGNKTRIISARTMHRRERAIYEQET